MGTAVDSNTLTPASRADSGSDLWFEAQEELHRSASASCSDLSQVGEGIERRIPMDAGGPTGDLQEEVTAKNDGTSSRPSTHRRLRQKGAHRPHSKSLSSLEALRELLSARRAFSPADSSSEEVPDRPGLMSWLPRLRWDKGRHSAGDSEDSATEREVEEAFRPREMSQEVAPDEADRAIPKAVHDLETALFTYHRNVKESIAKLRNQNAPENCDQLHLLTSILEEVMDLQTTIAAKKAEGPNLSLTGSMPRAGNIASKMVTKYHQKLSKGYYGYGHDSDTHSVGSNDDLLPELPPFVHDLDTLQDCNCSVAALPELDSTAMEEVLDDCHRHLFHDLPSLSLNMPSRSPSRNSGTVSKELMLDQVGQALSLVNEERQLLAELFACSLDVANMLIHEHRLYQSHMAALKDDYKIKLRALEDSMSKQIVSLLRVVEKQEVQLVRQRQLIQQFEDQGRHSDQAHPLSAHRSSSLHRQLSAHHVTSHTLDTRQAPSVGMSTSTPNLESSIEVELPLTHKARTQTIGRSQSVSFETNVVPVNGSDKPTHSFLSTEDAEAQPRWMTRALSWLQPPAPTSVQKSPSDPEEVHTSS